MMRYSTFLPIMACAFLVSSLAAVDCSARQERGAGGQVAIHGRASARQTVRRSGRLVPLREALVDIVPRSYSINLPNAGAWADTPVSWRGDHPFAEALRDILSGHPNLFADVDTDLRLVTVTQRASSFESPRVVEAMPSSSEAATPTSARSAMPSAGQERLQATGPTPIRPPLLEPASKAIPDAAADPVAKQPPLIAASGPDAIDASSSRNAIAAPPNSLAKAATPAANMGSGGGTDKRDMPSSMPVADARQSQSSPVVAPNVAQTESLPPREWHILLSDHTIKNALARWASEAGWQFVWDVPTDFSVDAAATITGTLEDALGAVVHALQHSQVPIQVILYKGNKVVRVVGEGAA